MATSSRGSNVNAGGSVQTGQGGSVTGGGSANVDFVGPRIPETLGPFKPEVPQAEIAGVGETAGQAQAALAAAQAAEERARQEAEAARKAAENKAKQQSKDKKIAADAQKAQRERRQSSKPVSTQSRENAQTQASPQQAQRSAQRAGTASTMAAQPTQATRQENVSEEEQAARQAHVRRAPGGQAYNSETGEQVEELASNNLQGTRFSPSTPAAPRQQRGAVIGRAGERTPGRPSASAAPSQAGAPAIPSTAQSAMPAVPAAPTQAPSGPAEFFDRQSSDRFFRNYSQARQAEARENNERIEGNYRQWAEQHPDAAGTVSMPDFLMDQEAFANEAEPLMNSGYRTLDRYEAGEEASGAGRERKDTRRMDEMIDKLAEDMKLGWFHVKGERVVKDRDTGAEEMRWSEPVEDAMSNVMEYLGLHGIDGQRTVFRLVRMYASMGVDADGKMFLEGEREWSLTENEFITICDFILRSCIEHGHPMAMPFKRWQLRGTDIYPSGVMPKTVAQAITGPESNLQMSPADLVQLCQDEWNARTYPTMKANLREDRSDEEGGRNEIAQRIAIERMQRAISRLDGISTEDFSRRYGVDTTLHYKLSEYEDSLAEYAVATNGNYDADRVNEKQQERLDYYKKQAMKQKGVKFRVEENDQLVEEIVVEGEKKRSYVQAGANLITSLAKINSVVFRPVLALASLNEMAVGTVRTKAAIGVLNAIENDGGMRYSVGDRYMERVKTEDSIKAMDAGMLLYEIGGPGACRLFRAEGKPLTHENAIKFLQDEYLPSSGMGARQLDSKREQLQRLSQKVMVGDFAFRKANTVNWFNALLISNASLANAQSQLAANGMTDQSGGIALTGAEIEDIMDAHSDIAGFFAEMLGTDAGISAFNMMRANTIAQVNPVSHYTDRFLRDHGVTNMMVTLFVDTFPQYGLNYIYNLVPFSRTLTYLGVKRTEGNQTANAVQNADLTIGGNLSDSGIDFDDPGFQAGLRQNLVFDAMTLGHNLLIGGVMGLTFLALGFEPPDDDENIFNISMWKIGGKEIQWAWWLNDLTLLGMPIAYFIAAGEKTGDWKLAGQLMMDCLHDQVDGNVVLDFVDIMTNWREDIMEFEQMSKDPSYTEPKDFTSFALGELYSSLLRAGNKLTIGAPLFDSAYRSALLRGIDARTADPRKVFKHSSTDEDLDKWYREHGVTENVDSYFEMLDRKYSTGNWLYALANNLRYGVLGNDQKTGFFWWEMPVRTMGDPLAYVWAGQFDVNYDNMPEGMSREQYDLEVGSKVRGYIDRFMAEGMNAADAVKNYGFMIPEPARKAALQCLYDELRTLDDEWIARNESGELADKNDYQVAKGTYYGRRSDINSIIYDWLKNSDIPDWGTEYEQLLTDYDVTYVYKDTGKPVPMGAWVDQFDPNVEPVYKPKGNHPTSLLPWTEVDYSDNVTDRGYNAETVPYWWHEGMTGSDAEALRNLQVTDEDGNLIKLEDAVIPIGRDTGEKLGDVLFGMQNSGSYSNPDEPTIGWRSYVPKATQLSDDIRNYGKDYEESWNEKKGSVSNAAWSGSTTYPKRSYGSSYGKSGYSSSSNYNPKIYAFKASNTRINSTHGSATRTNLNSRSVNADKAATMYSKQPGSTKTTTYLRPGFSTKGSREAYKRQDI